MDSSRPLKIPGWIVVVRQNSSVNKQRRSQDLYPSQGKGPENEVGKQAGFVENKQLKLY